MQPVYPTPPSPWSPAGKSVQVFQTPQRQPPPVSKQPDEAEEKKKPSIVIIAFAIIGLLVIGLLVSMICDNMKIRADQMAPQVTETILQAAVKVTKDRKQRAARFEKLKKEQWKHIPFKGQYKSMTSTGFATMEIAHGDESVDGETFAQFVLDHMNRNAAKEQRQQKEHTESKKMHMDAISEQNRRLHELRLELQRLEHQDKMESIDTKVELKKLSNKCKIEDRKRKTIEEINAIRAEIREAEEKRKAEVKAEEAGKGPSITEGTTS